MRLSRWRHGFKSRWGRHINNRAPRTYTISPWRSFFVLSQPRNWWSFPIPSCRSMHILPSLPHALPLPNSLLSFAQRKVCSPGAPGEKEYHPKPSLFREVGVRQVVSPEMLRLQSQPLRWGAILLLRANAARVHAQRHWIPGCCARQKGNLAAMGYNMRETGHE